MTIQSVVAPHADDSSRQPGSEPTTDPAPADPTPAGVTLHAPTADPVSAETVTAGAAVLTHPRGDPTPSSGGDAGAGPGPRTRNYRALLGQASAVSLANQLTATAVVLPYICIAVGGSPLIAAMLYPIGTFCALLGTLSAPVLTARRSNPFILTVGAVIAAAVTAGNALGSDLLGSPIAVVFLVTTAVLGFLGGLAAVSAVDLMSTSLLQAQVGRVSVLQTAISATLVLVVTAAELLFFKHTSALQSHIALLWMGAIAFAMAIPFILLVVPAPNPSRVRGPTLRQVIPLGVSQVREHRWLRTFLLVQTCFISLTLGTAFFSAHAAALHGNVVGHLHLIVAFTATGLIVYGFVWARTRSIATVRGMHVLAGGLIVAAALFAIAADTWDLPYEEWLFGVILALAAVASQVISTAKRVWLLRYVGGEHRAITIGFAQLVTSLASTLTALVLGVVAHLQGVVWPVYLLLALTLAALGTVRLIPSIRLDA